MTTAEFADEVDIGLGGIICVTVSPEVLAEDPRLREVAGDGERLRLFMATVQNPGRNVLVGRRRDY